MHRTIGSEIHVLVGEQWLHFRVKVRARVRCARGGFDSCKVCLVDVAVEASKRRPDEEVGDVEGVDEGDDVRADFFAKGVDLRVVRAEFVR